MRILVNNISQPLLDEFSNLRKCPAIYIFTNIKNGKRYIGETLNLKRRMEEYLFSGKRQKRIINNAIIKYGIDNFVFEYYYFPNFQKDDLLVLEKNMIEIYNSITPYGYNLCSYGTNCVGIKFSDRTKEKMRSAKSKKVYKYDALTGKYINSYISVDSAALDVKGVAPNISQASNGSRKTAHGFLWSYERKESLTPVKDIGITLSKIIEQYTIDGIFIKTFSSLREASSSVNGNHNNICNACNGKTKTAYGYCWKYGIPLV